VTDDSVGGSTPGDAGATTRIPRQAADDFQPDVPPDASYPTSGRPPADYGGDPTREPLSLGMPNEPPIEAATAEDDVHLIPGATIAGGRYRLLVFHGGPPHLQFWHALHTALDRQVALTFVDPDATLPDSGGRNPLADNEVEPAGAPGMARVLDVAGPARAGWWCRSGFAAGRSPRSPRPHRHRSAVPRHPVAGRRCRCRAPQGVALSIDHPGRVRVSIDGDVALAFPHTMPTATPEDDIRHRRRASTHC
jgi:putative peptidoglycan lipid II flippase